jgi:hypothetical protein
MKYDWKIRQWREGERFRKLVLLGETAANAGADAHTSADTGTAHSRTHTQAGTDSKTYARTDTGRTHTTSATEATDQKRLGITG